MPTTDATFGLYDGLVRTHATRPRVVMDIAFARPLLGQTLDDGSLIGGVILWEDGHYAFTSATTNVGGG